MLVAAIPLAARPIAGSLPLVLIVAGAFAGGLLVPLTRLAHGRVSQIVAGRRARRRRVQAAADAERRARAMMAELCPHGWRAVVHLYEGDAVQENGEPVRGKVALDWSELSGQPGEPAVVRRVWAPTVTEALEAMVADRRTDETLEQIELQASADGAAWPDA